VDDQDVGVRAMGHRVVDGALEQARHEAAVVGAEDDEIRLALVRQLDDRTRGLTARDDRLDSLEAELGESRRRVVDLFAVA
jgi:hypothetical protein